MSSKQPPAPAEAPSTTESINPAPTTQVPSTSTNPSQPASTPSTNSTTQQSQPQPPQQQQQQDSSTTTTTTTTTVAPPSPPSPPSPPLPPKPIPIPIAPGPRASRLQELFAQSLRHTLNKISWENMASCYPTIATNAPQLLRDIRKTMVARLEERCHREFEKIMVGRNVVAKLNELESLVHEAAMRRVMGEEEGQEVPIPPHQLPAEEIIKAHISRPLAAQRSQLNARLQNSQATNERLFAEIEAQRREIDELLGALERQLADVDGAAGLLEGVAEEVAAEAREREVEVEVRENRGRDIRD